jgi:tRNA threonylcarbamoyladenosine biosynthesis protein TsaB
MLILGLETATRNCSVALLRDGEIIAHHHQVGKAIHSEILPELIATITQQGQLLPELNAIAVSIGPGSYTGLRIGLATAKGMAFPRQLPILPVPTLAALEMNARRQWSAPLVLFIKSHRNLVYYITSANRDDFVLNRPVQHAPFDEILAVFPGYMLIGDAPELAPAGSIQECLPDAREIALIGYHYYDQLLPLSRPDLEPAYHSNLELKGWQA